MKIKGFKKLTMKEKEDEYGGWAWLASAVPLFLQTVMTTISTYKLLSSSKGSLKYDGTDAKWDNDDATSKKSVSQKHTFYAF